MKLFPFTSELHGGYFKLATFAAAGLLTTDNVVHPLLWNVPSGGGQWLPGNHTNGFFFSSLQSLNSWPLCPSPSAGEALLNKAFPNFLAVPPDFFAGSASSFAWSVVSPPYQFFLRNSPHFRCFNHAPLTEWIPESQPVFSPYPHPSACPLNVSTYASPLHLKSPRLKLKFF